MYEVNFLWHSKMRKYHVKICKGGNSVDVFLNIAEEKIRQAIRNGDLDNIPGKGKPLQLEDLSMVPPELRMSYKILKMRE